jgi:tumor protein p53-inducible protein 3
VVLKNDGFFLYSESRCANYVFMKALVIENKQLEISYNYPKPIPGAGELLIRVKASGLNRADVLQREGKYPPPAGASELPGLEIAGIIEEVGENCGSWKPGQAVMGLLPGGGYAEYAILRHELALPKPSLLSFAEAACLPEAFLTAHQALFWLAELKQGERVLIHAGASGVGTAAIQLAKAVGAEVFVTASAGKHEVCRQLGAKHTIDYKNENFAERILEITAQEGLDVVIDFIGAAYFHNNLKVLRTDGRLLMLALLGGHKAENISLALLLQKRLKIMGSTLRSRSVAYQEKLLADFWQQFGRQVETRALLPYLSQTFPWQEASKAHEIMETNQSVGKLALSWD